MKFKGPHKWNWVFGHSCSMCCMVWSAAKSHFGESLYPHFCNMYRHGPVPQRKRFKLHHKSHQRSIYH
jgi:hypothetical protein